MESYGYSWNILNWNLSRYERGGQSLQTHVLSGGYSPGKFGEVTSIFLFTINVSPQCFSSTKNIKRRKYSINLQSISFVFNFCLAVSCDKSLNKTKRSSCKWTKPLSSNRPVNLFYCKLKTLKFEKSSLCREVSIERNKGNLQSLSNSAGN